MTAASELAIKEHGGFTSLNFMLSDGDLLQTYRDFQTNGQYYTLYLDNLGEMVIAASEPILAMQAEPMPRGILHTISPDLTIRHTAVGRTGLLCAREALMCLSIQFRSREHDVVFG